MKRTKIVFWIFAPLVYCGVGALLVYGKVPVTLPNVLLWVGICLGLFVVGITMGVGRR